MSRNLQRQMNMLDIPTGDLGAFKREGGKIKLYDSGGGGGASSTQTQTTDLPEWAQPYAKDILAKGKALTDIGENPYQKYDKPRIAEFGDLQKGAMEGARTMGPSSQLGTATDMAGLAGLGALGTNYQAGRFSGGQFGNQAAEQYMNPYMQNVVDVQQREAQRQADISGTQRGAQAVKSGAFGGSRQAIMDAEAARNLALQKGDIQAQGLNQSYQQAQAQFNADQARRMQAQQLGEQSRQYGAGLGLQGLQTGLQAAGTLGQLGGQQFQQGLDINKLQSAYGGMEQAQRQQGLDIGYQDFLNQQNYPYKQLGFMSDLLRGTPTGSSSVTQMYQPPGSALGQIAGIGTGIYGLSKFMAEGGEVDSYAEGGVTSQGNVESIIEKLSDQQLQVAFQNAQARNDMATMQAIQQELAMRASEKQGMAGAFNMLPQASQEDVVQAAGGGIIAFADGDMVSDPMGTGASEMLDTPYQATGMTGLQKFMSRFQNEPEWKIKEAEAKAMKEAKASQAKPAAPSPKVQPKGQAARSTPAAVAPDVVAAPAPAKEKPIERRYEDLANAPKPSKAQVKSAVNELAEKYNLSPDIKEDVMKTAKEIRNELDKENAPMLDELRKAIEAQKPDTEAMRNRGIGQALAEFGFKFAAEAAKPGAKFLGSAAAASPALSAASAKMQELETAANQNFAKLKLDQTKYEVALKKGDMQAASTLAAQIRQGQQQDRAFQLQLAQAQDNAQLEREKMAMTGDYYRSITSRQPENVMSLATQLMKDPAFKGTQNDAIEKAAYLLKGGISAGIRSDTASAANLDKALKDITAKYPLLKIMKTSDPEYASMKAAYDRDVRDAYARHGGAGISDALPSSNATNMAAKGFKNLGAE
jgi:hypothetical protein